jgi:hypothetical protein
MYRYFISYVFSNHHRATGNGWIDIVRNEPIRSGRDLDAIKADLLRNDPNIAALTITGWQRFED